MKHRIALCVGLTASAIAVTGATSAQAQVYAEPPRGYVAAPPPPDHYGGLPPNEILMAVRASGLRPLTQPARQGPQQYVLLASDNMGGQLRVVVDAHNGRIVHAAPAHDPRFAYHPARPRGFIPMPGPQPQHGAVAPPPSYGAAPPPDVREPTPPLPRTARATPPAPQARAPQNPSLQNPSLQNPSLQNPSLASAPDVTGAVPSRPARTPLPRPRPAIAANEAGAEAPAPVQTRQVVAPETSPEAEQASAAKPVPAAPSAAPARAPAAETQMVPVAPLD